MKRETSLVVALLGLAGALLLSCGGDRPRSDAPFSKDYPEARGKFLAAARAAGATLDRHEHPRPGPAGEPLFTDVARIGPAAATKALVVISGTHGVEGFCGSAVQAHLLRQGLASSLPEDVRVVLVHAMNPFGFAWLRRFDEDNVDLNRNFIDHAVPHPNPGYDVLAEEIEAEALDLARVTAIAREHGLPDFRAAATQGQYRHPKGVFYGGTKPTWARRTLAAIVEEHLAGARHVALVDIHTGLGAHGAVECILNEKVETPAFQRARSWWGELARSTYEDSISKHVTGSLKWGFARMFRDAEVTAVSLEFGTSPLMEVFRALHAETWAHHHLSAEDPRTARAKAELRRVFYPESEAWRRSVLVEAERVIRSALEGLAAS
jgi:hypothetical protein